MLAVSSAAWANLSIDRLWVEFPNGQPGRSDVVIRNDSEERYYVTVTVAEIRAPGTEQEERVAVADPEALGLLVTPNRLVLEPGALRSIRLVSLNETLTEDRVYRVLISPQLGALQVDETVEPDTQGIVMKLMAAYDVLVVAKPSEARANLVAERTSTEVVLRNDGNTSILIAEGQVCPAGVTEGDSCRAIDAKRMYAGNVLRVPLENADEKLLIKTRDGPSGAIVDRQI